MSSRANLLFLIVIWATLALALKVSADVEAAPPSPLMPCKVRRVEIEWQMRPAPAMFAPSADKARAQPEDVILKVTAIEGKARMIREVKGRPASTTTINTDALLYRLAALDLSSPPNPRRYCAATVEHYPGGSAFVRLRVVHWDGRVSEQTAEAQYGNCSCLRHGGEGIARLGRELTRAGLKV